MWSYRSRVERDLPRWRTAGWVTAEGDRAIRTELAQSGRGIGLAGALAILGACLLGFAVMSFVAAHWDGWSKLGRIGLLLAALWICYGLAGYLFRRDLAIFAHAAVLAGVAVFGASIMLIAQMFHIEGDPPAAVLVWALGALLAGVLFGSNPALALSMILACVWTSLETFRWNEVHWLFLPVWALIACAFFFQRWRPGLHISIIALAGWIITTAYLFSGFEAHWLVVATGALMAAAGYGASQLPRTEHLAAPLQSYGFAMAFAGFLPLQFEHTLALTDFVMRAALAIAISLAAIAWGFRSGNRGLLWLGYIGFSIEVLSVYFKTVGTLLGSSVFFLTAGLIVIGLSVLAWRLHKTELSVAEAAQ